MPRPTRPNSPEVEVAGSSKPVYARVFDKSSRFGKTSGSYKLDVERPDSRYSVSARMLVRVPNNSILPLPIAVKYASPRRLQHAHVMFLLRHCLCTSFFGKAFKNFCRSIRDGGVAGKLACLTCSLSSFRNPIFPAEIGQGIFPSLVQIGRNHLFSQKR